MDISVGDDGSIEQTLETMISVAMDKYKEYLPMLEDRERYCISPAD